MLDQLCQRWGSPPSVILEEATDIVLGTLTILEAAGDFDRADAKGEDEESDESGIPAMEETLAEMSIVDGE